jgi:hypothetical protein
MVFQVVESRHDQPPKHVPCILLERMTWDDFGHKTLFRAYLVDTSGSFELGRVKILQKGKSTPDFVQDVFTQLDETYCSLGQGPEYYRRLQEHGVKRGQAVLEAMRDIAFKLAIGDAFDGEPGLRLSLLRFPSAELARAEARRLFVVDAAAPPPEDLAFTFSTRLLGFEGDHVVPFVFPHGKGQLGRIVAIAGRNGVGKTQLIARLAQALSGLGAAPLARMTPERRARVVVVSFNAFDQFTTPINNIPGGDYSYYGLRPPPHRTPNGVARSEVNVAYAMERLRASVEQIWRLGSGYQRDWSRLLESTGVFRGEPELINPFAPESTNPIEVGKRTRDFTDRLRSASAGHQLMVFVATALVESVRPGSVVFLDEPECHLHPKLLSTLIRELYELLEDRQAYAVIATHSPIVLQELPGRSIQILRQMEGRLPLVKQYPLESFGETLDGIIEQAFGVNEVDRSYRTILEQLTKENRSRADIEAMFDGLGFNARLLLRELFELRGAR